MTKSEWFKGKRGHMARAAVIILATAVLSAAMAVSFRRLPEEEEMQTYSDVAAENVEAQDALAEFRTERAGSRIAEMAALDKLISEGSAENSDAASLQKRELVACMETENTLEGLLKAKGFANAVCTVHSDSCNVLVRAENLTPDRTALILSLASAETGLSAANIKIIPVS